MKIIQGVLVGAALFGAAFLIERATAASVMPVRVTHYYETGNAMYSGIYPYHGAAACSWNFPLGTIVRFADGREVVCLDRGRLGDQGWIDIYAATWAEGQRIQQAYEYWWCCEDVEIVRWGW